MISPPFPYFPLLSCNGHAFRALSWFRQTLFVLVLSITLPVFRLSECLPNLRQRSICPDFGNVIDFYFLGFRLTVGRNHLFSYPPLLGFLSACPDAPLPTPSAIFYLCIGLSSLFILNIFCLSCSFLYFYYSTKFSFVKCFSKIFLDFFNFFEVVCFLRFFGKPQNDKCGFHERKAGNWLFT